MRCTACRKKGCRLKRPLCKWMAEKTERYRKCSCGAYHYPHRNGSGRCVSHPKHAMRMWEYVTGEPLPEGTFL